MLRTISLQRFFANLVQLGGVKGTVAVGLAYFLHLDAFGSLHLSAPDALTALVFAAPILVADAVLMAPDWELAPDAAVAEAPVEPSVTLALDRTRVSPRLGEKQDARDPWNAFCASAALFQRLKVSGNPAAGLALWQEGLLVLVGHLADEMLSRAVLLTALGRWARDRLYEADVVAEGSADTAGLWLALALVLALEATRKQRSLFRTLPVQAAVLGKDKITGRTKVTALEPASLADLSTVPALVRNLSDKTSADPEAMRRIQQQVLAARERASTVAQIDAVRSLVDWCAYGGSFVVTGNLFAPFLASTLVDVAFSGYQRRGAARQFVKNRARYDAANALLQRKMAAAAGQAAAAEKEGDASDTDTNP